MDKIRYVRNASQKVPMDIIRDAVETYINGNYPFYNRMPSETRLDILNVIEETLMRLVLKRHGGNCSRVALTLGVNRNTIKARLTKYNINFKDYVSDAYRFKAPVATDVQPHLEEKR